MAGSREIISKIIVVIVLLSKDKRSANPHFLITLELIFYCFLNIEDLWNGKFNGTHSVSFLQALTKEVLNKVSGIFYFGRGELTTKAFYKVINGLRIHIVLITF